MLVHTWGLLTLIKPLNRQNIQLQKNKHFINTSQCQLNIHINITQKRYKFFFNQKSTTITKPIVILIFFFFYNTVPKRKHKFLAEVYLMKSHFSSGKERERAMYICTNSTTCKEFHHGQEQGSGLAGFNGNHYKVKLISMEGIFTAQMNQLQI